MIGHELYLFLQRIISPFDLTITAVDFICAPPHIIKLFAACHCFMDELFNKPKNLAYLDRQEFKKLCLLRFTGFYLEGLNIFPVRFPLIYNLLNSFAESTGSLLEVGIKDELGHVDLKLLNFYNDRLLTVVWGGNNYDAIHVS